MILQKMKGLPTFECEFAENKEDELEMGTYLILHWNDSAVKPFMMKQEQDIGFNCPIGPFQSTLNGTGVFKVAFLNYLVAKLPGCWVQSNAVLVCPDSRALSKIILQITILPDQCCIQTVLAQGESLLDKLTRVSCMHRGVPRALEIPNSILFRYLNRISVLNFAFRPGIFAETWYRLISFLYLFFDTLHEQLQALRRVSCIASILAIIMQSTFANQRHLHKKVKEHA